MGVIGLTPKFRGFMEGALLASGIQVAPCPFWLPCLGSKVGWGVSLCRSAPLGVSVALGMGLCLQGGVALTGSDSRGKRVGAPG